MPETRRNHREWMQDRWRITMGRKTNAQSEKRSGAGVRAALGASVVLLMACVSALPASAQWFGRSYAPVIIEEDNLRPSEVARIIERMGYRQVARPRLVRDSYLVDATTRGGTRVRLVVDAFTGHVVDSFLAPQQVIPQQVERPRPHPPRERIVRAPEGEDESPARDGRPQVVPSVPRAEPPRQEPRPPTVVRREPMLPPQAPPSAAPAPRPPQPPQARPATPPAAPAAQPPVAQQPGTGTRVQPRRIDGAPPPPAPLDDAERFRREQAPINSVPPAAF
jgi:hypothetical protein